MVHLVIVPNSHPQNSTQAQPLFTCVPSPNKECFSDGPLLTTTFTNKSRLAPLPSERQRQDRDLLEARCRSLGLRFRVQGPAIRRPPHPNDPTGPNGSIIVFMWPQQSLREREGVWALRGCLRGAFLRTH